MRPKGSNSRPGAGRSPGAPKGNQNAATIGHRAAEKALQKGEPFRGLALAKQKEVEVELELDGVDALLIRDAVRLQTVTDLYYDAILCAEQSGKLKTLDRYLTRHASLTARAMAAWGQVREMQNAKNDDALDYEQILQQRQNAE